MTEGDSHRVKEPRLHRDCSYSFQFVTLYFFLNFGLWLRLCSSFISDSIVLRNLIWWFIYAPMPKHSDLAGNDSSQSPSGRIERGCKKHSQSRDIDQYLVCSKDERLFYFSWDRNIQLRPFFSIFKNLIIYQVGLFIHQNRLYKEHPTCFQQAHSKEFPCQVSPTISPRRLRGNVDCSSRPDARFVPN